MVRLSYEELYDSYEYFLRPACSRLACSVMIITANEVDAMASTRILTQQLRKDHIAYTVLPVSDYIEVEEIFNTNITTDIKTVFMFNCGATYNIDRLIRSIGDDINCLIMDNHRPIHLANIYSNCVQVFDDGEEMNFDVQNNLVPDIGTDLSCPEDSEDDKADYQDDDESIRSTESIDEDSEAEVEEEQEAEFDEENGEEDVEAADEEAEVVDGGNDDAEADDAEADDENEDDDDDDENVDEQKESLQIETAETVIEDYNEVNNETLNTSNEANISNEANTSNEIEDEEEEEEDIQIRVRRRKQVIEENDPKKKRRKDLRKYYNIQPYYIYPTSKMMINLCSRRDTNLPVDLVWQAILGVTDQYHRRNIKEEVYEQCHRELKQYIAQHLEGAKSNKYTVGEGDEAYPVPGASTGHVQDGNEYRFFMFRHWSLYDSMFYSPYIASKLSVWQNQGETKLKDLLAKVGISLQQCKQNYSFMNKESKEHFRHQIVKDDIKNKFRLTGPDVVYKSFYRYNSFRNPIAATDVVYASSALAELCGQGTPDSKKEAFNDAYDCMGMNDDIFKRGKEIAIDLQKTIVRKAQAILEGKDLITKMSNFYYAYVHTSVDTIGPSADGNDSSTFSRPEVLTRLGHYITEVKCNMEKGVGGWVKKPLPLIIASKSKDGYIVVGVSPLSYEKSIAILKMRERDDNRGNNSEETTLQNLCKFNLIFKSAASLSLSEGDYRCNSFDSNIFEVADINSFIGALSLFYSSLVR